LTDDAIEKGKASHRLQVRLDRQALQAAEMKKQIQILKQLNDVKDEKLKRYEAGGATPHSAK